MKQKRIIAFDIHPSHFGYVVFDGPNELLDWGVRSFRGGVNAVRGPASEKFGILLDDFVPAAIVIEKRTPRTRKLYGKIAAVLREAEKHRVPVHWITRRMVKRTFAGHERNKDEIATVLGERFPELTSRVPPRRRIWQSEDYRMGIFDAAALGAAYFNRYAHRSCPVPPENLIPD
jgi:hypothetical protein